MMISFAIIIMLGLFFGSVFTKMRLPGLLGMLLLGILIGPYGLNIIEESIMNISGDIRKIALIIILLRAGLGIKRSTIQKVGKTAFKISFIPGILEGISVMLVSSYIFNLSVVEAGILGFIIAAVSPAVIVPQMLDLIQRRKGEKRGVPTIILAGASVDDVIAITIFSSFLGMYGGQQVHIAKQFLSIPLSILLGIFIGVIVALVLINIFNRQTIADTKKVLIVLGSAILLTSIEDLLQGRIPVASLLGVMAMGFVLLEKSPTVGESLSISFNKIWIFAEIFLFVLVGATVNIDVAWDAGLLGLVIISIGLVARSIGVYISLLGTDLNIKEKLFCIISYIPKATVQAAIGAMPLSMGVASGELILALAVLSIIITAPLGAIGIKIAGERFLNE